MKKLLFPLLLLIFLSCKSKKNSEPLSPIEVIKFDSKVTDSLKKVSDSSYRQPYGETGTWDTYFNSKDSTEARIMIDPDGYLSFYKFKNNKLFHALEYYPNGQLKILKPDGYSTTNGLVRYYYEDGRVKSEGFNKNGFPTGTCREYDEKGRLVSSKEYPKF